MIPLFAILMLWLAGSVRALLMFRGVLYRKELRLYDVEEAIRMDRFTWLDDFDRQWREVERNRSFLVALSYVFAVSSWITVLWMLFENKREKHPPMLHLPPMPDKKGIREALFRPRGRRVKLS